MNEIVIELDPKSAEALRNAIEKGIIPLVGWGGGISFGTGGRGGK